MAGRLAPTQEWVLSQDEITAFNRVKQQSLEESKPMVLWGWKRDKIMNGVRQPESRTVYFSADLQEQHRVVSIERAFFFLDTRAKSQEIDVLKKRINDNYHLVLKSDDPNWLRMAFGEPTDYDLATVDRRLKGKPRISIDPPRLVPESDNYDLSSLAPFDLCVGSGLSAESGLPLLGTIHDLFEVDNRATGELVFGAADNLPQRIASNPEAEFTKFCQFTIDAIKAQPSDSHRAIADLYQKGIIKEVFTDNMDDILDKVGVPYTKTRLSIFPDRYPAKFNPEAKALLVVGVAVDRRDVIKQARRAGLKIISINPVLGVAPHSRNMDYLYDGDIFFKQTAHEALPKIVAVSGF